MPKSKHRKNHTTKVNAYKKSLSDGKKKHAKMMTELFHNALLENQNIKKEEVSTVTV